MYNIIAYVHYLTDSFKNMNYKEHVILPQPNLNVAWANRDSLLFWSQALIVKNSLQKNFFVAIGLCNINNHDIYIKDFVIYS